MATSRVCSSCSKLKPREHFKGDSRTCRMCERKAERVAQTERRKAKDAEQRRELRKLRERVRDLEAELEGLREEYGFMGPRALTNGEKDIDDEHERLDPFSDGDDDDRGECPW